MSRFKNDWFYQLSSFLSNIWTHVYGAISAVSFIIALIFSMIAIRKPEGPEFSEALYVLTGLIAILTISLIMISAKYGKLHSVEAKLMKCVRENDELYFLLRLQSETIHNVTHYHRNLTRKIDSYINTHIHGNKAFNKDEAQHILERNEYFLILLTTALQNYFAIYTDDNCAVTVKLLSDDKSNIKTLFRDPINLKRRRKAEDYYKNGYYSIDDNTAFEIIIKNEYTNIYFANDNLKQLYSNHRYKNSNKNWHEYYNATIVVPISFVISKNERNIVGFITVDNFKGGLSDKHSLEFLFGIADLIYCYFEKMRTFVKFLHENNYKNEKTERFFFGSNCG